MTQLTVREEKILKRLEILKQINSFNPKSVECFNRQIEQIKNN